MNTDDYFPDAETAMAGPMEPVVPCENMETRPCVDITGEWDGRRFRTIPCPDVCVRYPERSIERRERES